MKNLDSLADIVAFISPKESPLLPRTGLRRLVLQFGKSMRARRRRLVKPIAYRPWRKLNATLHEFDHEGLAMARCDHCRIEINGRITGNPSGA